MIRLQAEDIILDTDDADTAVIEWSNDPRAGVVYEKGGSVYGVWYNEHWASDDEMVEFAEWLQNN